MSEPDKPHTLTLTRADGSTVEVRTRMRDLAAARARIAELTTALGAAQSEVAMLERGILAMGASTDQKDAEIARLTSVIAELDEPKEERR